MRSDGSANTDWQAERVPVLDSANMRARTDEQGRLEVTLPDGRVYTNARVVSAFPISRPNRFLYFRDEEGNELGLLVDPKGLDRESLELLLAQADQAYFMPHITRIISVEEKMGIARWEVETDRGWSTFEVVSRGESTWYVGRNRVLIRDADGNRYLIEDLTTLDQRSRGLADLHL